MRACPRAHESEHESTSAHGLPPAQRSALTRLLRLSDEGKAELQAWPVVLPVRLVRRGEVTEGVAQ
jgi:hypothetical protein